MDPLILISLCLSLCIVLNIISAFLINYSCQKVVLKLQNDLQYQIDQEKVYVSKLKANLETFLRHSNKVQKKDHRALKVLATK